MYMCVRISIYLYAFTYVYIYINTYTCIYAISFMKSDAQDHEKNKNTKECYFTINFIYFIILSVGLRLFLRSY
jgi:hypothetical protein